MQIVSLDNWDDLDFFIPDFSMAAFNNICDIYEKIIVKKYSYIFGNLILFHIPCDYYLNDIYRNTDIFDNTVIVNDIFRKNIKYKNDIIFKDKDTELLFNDLKEKGLLKVIKGKRNSIHILPVGDKIGFLSKNKLDSRLKVNASFFVFDCLDVNSIYDRISVPIGLFVKNGRIINPSMFDREALLVDKNNNVSIRNIRLDELVVKIDSLEFIDKTNCKFYYRPDYIKTQKGGFDIVIVDNKVVAVNENGETIIPSAGFVIKVDKRIEIKDLNVTYNGFNDYKFVIQVGNSVIRNNIITDNFISKFYDFKKFWNVSFPPSMYPLNYKKDKAARIVLGCDKNNKPMIIWFEGAGKYGYCKGKDSEGVSLLQVADICKNLGMVNGVHLDGGGSAQILIDNKKALRISDRNPDDFSEMERAVSLSLFV